METSRLTTVCGACLLGFAIVTILAISPAWGAAATLTPLVSRGGAGLSTGNRQ